MSAEINVIDNELSDDTSPNGDMVPDETESKSVLPDTTDQNKTTSDALPDKTKVLLDEMENNNNIVDSEVLPDKMDNNDTVNTEEQRLSASSIISTDGYPDTTGTASTLHEATDVTSNDPASDTPSNNTNGNKLENKTTDTTINENHEEMSHGATSAVLPDETA